jgi:hypothetical protein
MTADHLEIIRNAKPHELQYIKSLDIITIGIILT